MNTPISLQTNLQRAWQLRPCWVGLAIAVLTTSIGHAQWARKPSYYDNPPASAAAGNPAPAGSANAQPPMTKPSPPGTGSLKGLVPPGSARTATPAGRMANPSGPADLSALHTRAEFDQLARVYDAGTPLAQPHVIFVLDRGTQRGAAPQLLFVNTPRFQLHERFLRDTRRFMGTREAFNRNYSEPNRRFVLGTLSWQPQIQAFVYEFWEGDRLTPELLALTAKQLKAHFFAPVQFKANALAQEQVARGAGMPVVTQAQLIGQQRFLPLNMGKAVGRLRIVADIDRMRDLQPSDIVVLRQVPLSLPPVAGVITEQPSTLLSHVNLLAKGWGIPNAYVHGASQQLAALDGQWVQLNVTAKDHQVRAASAAERQAAQQWLAQAATRAPVATIEPDVRKAQPVALTALRAING